MIPNVKCNFIKRPSGQLDYAIDEQLEMCRTIPGYLLMIVGHDDYFIDYAFKYIDKNIIDRNEIKPIKKLWRPSMIRFTNGSVIFLRQMKHIPLISHCVDAAICDFMLDNDYFEDVILPCVTRKVNGDNRVYVARIAMSYSESSEEYSTGMPNIELQSISSNEYTLVYSHE